MHDFNGISLKSRHMKCFGEQEQGFEQIKPLNLLIGRNNAGKSALLDLLEIAVNGGKNIPPSFSRHSQVPEILIEQPLSEITLRKVFRDSNGGGGVPGRNHWEFGEKLIGRRARWHLNALGDARNLELLDCSSGESPIAAIRKGAPSYYTSLADAQENPFAKLVYRRLSAERNLAPEADKTNDGNLSTNGVGGTNLIQTFLNKASLPRDLIEVTLLKELNAIFEPDAKFTGIHCRQLVNDVWEIYLREDSKGSIPLSQSGSGLKTIILTLLNIHVIPVAIRKPLSDFIFCFEELENNLHPALQRRLLTYLDLQAEKNGCTFALTTHSNIAIDIFNTNTKAQIIHITHDGSTATCRTVHTYIENKGILDDLDVRASDLLQSNGIIWVEGPTDRIYLNRWISLWSDGQLKEGVHYQCVFYGGRLLAHISAGSPSNVAEEALPILRVNKNAIVLIDSDRKNVATNINATKHRIQKEISGIGGLAWVTAGREIENYIPAKTIGRWLGLASISQVDPYDHFFADYLEKIRPNLGSYVATKPLFAEQIIPHMAKDDIRSVLDLAERLDEVCTRIRRWNNIP